jgi:hypothetical protein
LDFPGTALTVEISAEEGMVAKQRKIVHCFAFLKKLFNKSYATYLVAGNAHPMSPSIIFSHLVQILKIRVLSRDLECAYSFIYRLRFRRGNNSKYFLYQRVDQITVVLKEISLLGLVKST